MAEAVTTPMSGELFDRAVAAAAAHLSFADRHEVEAALQAAIGVYDTHHEEEVQRLVDATTFEGLTVENDGLKLRVVMADRLKLAYIEAMKATLDACPGAENYVEQTVTTPRGHEPYERYVFIVCKPGGKTPHELRRQAEAQRDELAAEVERLRGAL